MSRQPLAIAATIIGIAASLGFARPAAAHHSFALFDTTRSIDVEGTVKRFDWANPHSWIFLEATGPQNSVEEWTIELPAAGALAREGWNKNFVKPGERIVVRINPLKNGQKGGSLEGFTPEPEH